jgi:DNA anti-recombination protein RmuC
MTLDERLEALTQSVELLVHSNRDNEAHITAMREENERSKAENERRITAMREENERRFAEISRLFAQTHEFINSLAHVAEAHEQRLDDLES